MSLEHHTVSEGKGVIKEKGWGRAKGTQEPTQKGTRCPNLEQFEQQNKQHSIGL